MEKYKCNVCFDTENIIVLKCCDYKQCICINCFYKCDKCPTCRKIFDQKPKINNVNTSSIPQPPQPSLLSQYEQQINYTRIETCPDARIKFLRTNKFVQHLSMSTNQRIILSLMPDAKLETSVIIFKTINESEFIKNSVNTITIFINGIQKFTKPFKNTEYKTNEMIKLNDLFSFTCWDYIKYEKTSGHIMFEFEFINSIIKEIELYYTSYQIDI